MKNTIKNLTMLAILLGAAIASADTALKELTLVHYGWLSYTENDQVVSVKEFRLSYGDTTQQDELSSSPGRISFGAFAMNGAFYYRRDDGAWNLFNFRLPSESLTDPKAFEERQKFRDYLLTPEVQKVMESPYAQVDFGSEQEFIHKRMGLQSSQLPEPFNRLSERSLQMIESILIYNADKTAKIYLKKPLDLDGKAQEVFALISGELSKKP